MIWFVFLKRHDSFVKTRLQDAKNGSGNLMEAPTKSSHEWPSIIKAVKKREPSCIAGIVNKLNWTLV